jgi:hypothetical protein
MWRAFFLAIGINLVVWGAECLVIEKAVLAGESKPAETPYNPLAAEPVRSGPREIRPPEGAPWSLLSAGAVVILYSFTIPRRVASG